MSVELKRGFNLLGDLKVLVFNDIHRDRVNTKVEEKGLHILKQAYDSPEVGQRLGYAGAVIATCISKLCSPRELPQNDKEMKARESLWTYVLGLIDDTRRGWDA